MKRLSRQDALLLYAVAYCYHHKGVATLHGIFAATDAIFRIAPTFEELHAGFTRLHVCNLLVEDNGGYSPTEKGLALYRKVNEVEGNVFDHILLLTKELENYCADAITSNSISLDPETVEKARQSYYET